jgi:glycosyltransferase involved in cell wall biosynthesis
MAQEKIPFVTIIVPTRDRYALLRQCLEALGGLDYPRERYKVVVVDDGSRDETRERMLQEETSGLRHAYIRLDGEQGVSAARNRGLSEAEGDLVAFVDDDCVVEQDWLKLIAEAFSVFPDAGAVGGSVLNPHDTPVGWASYILEFSTWFPIGKVRRIRDIPACNIAYRRSDIAGMSFRDMGKDAVYEDSIFNYQLRARGKAIIFDPRIKVHHYRSEDRLRRDGFLKSQQRYGRGFIRGGYEVHGVWGKLLLRVPVLNLICFRLVFVFMRCLKSQVFLKRFILLLPLIVAGEQERNKSWNE